MKRILSLAVAFAALMLCQNTFAQPSELMYKGTEKYDSIGIITGSASIFNEKGINCSLKYDFSKAHIVNFDRDNVTVIEDFGSIDAYNKSHGEDYVRDWPHCLDMLEVGTCLELTKKFKATFYTPDIPVDMKYDIVIKLALFDLGHFVFVGSLKAGGNIAKGIMYVYKAGTKQLVASFDLNYLRGKNIGYGDEDRLRQYGKTVAKELAAIAK